MRVPAEPWYNEPISGFSLHWFGVAWHDTQVRSAFLLSVRVGLLAARLAGAGAITRSAAVVGEP